MCEDNNSSSEKGVPIETVPSQIDRRIICAYAKYIASRISCPACRYLQTKGHAPTEPSLRASPLLRVSPVWYRNSLAIEFSIVAFPRDSSSAILATKSESP